MVSLVGPDDKIALRVGLPSLDREVDSSWISEKETSINEIMKFCSRIRCGYATRVCLMWPDKCRGDC